jgi:hypothetical protein
MEIYTEEKFKEFVEERRDPELTKVIIQNIEVFMVLNLLM